ncbi:CdaR family transcriptional regulator [Gallibacterium anatis]|uniref:Sugar diacid regulator n=1 Tax=Gallibacterium anatis TaxID=750 RepID=A0A0A2XQV6_9PAST|nr:sugar diacid recognition domain-containing protein [Gallibacterium anatis]KGQ33065.1 hypothetical protein JP32_03375 [Gallibacterium anatis]
MKINKEIAQKIVWRTMKIIPYSVNVMDENGVIIASGNASRLNQRHTGAVLAIRENRVVEITAELAKLWNFEAHEGINLPINYQGKILGVVGISGKPDEVKPFAELVKMSAELIAEQAFVLEQERWHHRYKEEFILQLLNGVLDAECCAQQASFFAIDLTKPYVAVIIKLIDSTKADLQELINYLAQVQNEQDLHFALLSFETVVVLSANPQLKNRQYLSKLLPPNSSVHRYKFAVGAMRSDDVDLSFSYKTAVRTLAYGQRFFPKRNVYFFEEYKLPVLLDELLQSWQVSELLKPLQKLYQKDHSHQLQKTLQQYFFSNCDPARTATELFIHINTLRYRLNRIEQITGLSFNKIEDLFILYLSTLLKR